MGMAKTGCQVSASPGSISMTWAPQPLMPPLGGWRERHGRCRARVPMWRAGPWARCCLLKRQPLQLARETAALCLLPLLTSAVAQASHCDHVQGQAVWTFTHTHLLKASSLWSRCALFPEASVEEERQEGAGPQFRHHVQSLLLLQLSLTSSGNQVWT